MTLLTDQGRAAVVPRPSVDLSRLIDPVDAETFRREYWQRRPLYVHRDDPGYFDGLLSLADVDRVLSLSTIRGGDLRVVQEGKEVEVSKLVPDKTRTAGQLDALYEKYRTGHTVVINALDNRWEPLRQLVRSLGAEVNARFQVNVYVTPAGNRGFRQHYDTHDVFVAQVHGTKHWQLAQGPIELPLESQSGKKPDPEPAPEREIEMRCGDLLYLPRGTLHAATANDTASVHLTIGMHPVLWSQVLEDAVTEVFHTDVRFRESLPLGFARDEGLRRLVQARFGELVATLGERLPPAGLAADAVARATSIARPVLDGHILDLEHLDEVAVDTKVARRPELQFDIAVEGDVVRLRFHGKAVRLPAHVAEEVRYVAESDRGGFTGRDIPGDLDEPGRVVLVRTLVREGFLALV
jgi:ribosomal protein L16 Arg81 hydroxylase